MTLRRFAPHLRDGPLHRLAALALATLALLLPLVAGAGLVRGELTRLAAETDALLREAAEFRALAAGTAGVVAARDATLAAVAEAGVLAEGASAEQALSGLQGRIGTLAEETGVEVTRLAPGVPAPTRIGQRLPLGIELEAEATAVLRFLAAIESGTPFLTLTRVELRRIDQPGEGAARRLRLKAEVAAYWRAAEGTQ